MKKERKPLTKKQKILLIVGAALLVSSGALGTVFGVRAHNKHKAVPTTDLTVSK